MKPETEKKLKNRKLSWQEASKILEELIIILGSRGYPVQQGLPLLKKLSVRIDYSDLAYLVVEKPGGNAVTVTTTEQINLRKKTENRWEISVEADDTGTERTYRFYHTKTRFPTTAADLFMAIKRAMKRPLLPQLPTATIKPKRRAVTARTAVV